MAAFDPAGIVRVLNQHGVRFVVIGGIAAQAHDLGLPATIDIDVTPARDRRNLARLAAAFDELEAGLNTADMGGTWLPRLPVANWAQYDTLHLITRYGLLDIVFAPDGAKHGYCGPRRRRRAACVGRRARIGHHRRSVASAQSGGGP